MFLKNIDIESHTEQVDTESEGEQYGMTRRQAAKFLAGAGTIAMGSIAGCAGDGDEGSSDGDEGDGDGDGDGEGGDGEDLISVPRNDDAFADVRSLQWYALAINGPIFDMIGPSLEEESGVTFGAKQLVSPGNAYSRLNSDLIGGDPSFDIAGLQPLHLGDIQSRDLFEPLGQYLDQYEGTDGLLDSIITPIKAFYMEWDGEIVGLPYDGDVHVLNYRPSYFEDETHQEQYMEQYGQELRVPRTWPEYNQVAKYFTENTEDGVFGAQVYGARPWNFAYYMNRAASKGVVYFDEEMNPQINSPEAVEALEHMVETLDYAPPGSAQFGVDSTISNWQEGKVVMSPWWIDLPEFTARADVAASGDQASTRMPGWEQDDGSIRANAMMAVNHIFGIPAAADESVKPAAFYAIMRVTHPDYSLHLVADPFTGMDPFLQDHYTDDAAQSYLEPNPVRGTGEGFEDNPPIFDDIETARQHLKAGQENLEIGFPQPNWPGANQYIESFSIHVQRALAGQESPQEALDAVASEWETTVEELGRESQKQAYNQLISSARELGYV